MLRYLVGFIGLWLYMTPLCAQNTEVRPTISPQFFSADEEITITYDVTGTSLSSLSEAWIWLWLPELSNVDVASNVNPANSDPSKTDVAKFTKVQENGKTYFSLSLTLTDFTSKSAAEIEKVGMLIKGNDWSNGQSIDHLMEILSGYNFVVNSPVSNYSFYDAGQTINFDIDLSANSEAIIKLDGEIVFNQSDVKKITYGHTVIDDGQVHKLDFTATNGTENLAFSHSYIITPEVETAALPEGKLDGVNHDSNTSVTLVLTAPYKNNVFVIGDFNDWSLNRDYLMKKDGDKFWLTIEGLNANTEYIYQYLVNGDLVIADPYSEKVSSQYDDGEIIADNRYPGLKPYPAAKTSREASFLQVGMPEYEWVIDDFQKPAREDLVIYELLVRDFSEDRTYRAVIDKLDYLDSLGINAIELMPVTEFEGNLSWGYNPSYMLAQDKYYGTEDDLRALIDAAHQRGMAIIFDMVLNHHFGRSPLVALYSSGEFGPPTGQNVWFNTTPKHDYNVGYDFNHESNYTKEYVKRVVQYWTDKYKVDGYRFDLSKGFTQKNTLGNVGAWGQYDASRIAIWKNIADIIWDQDPETYIILEHFADNSEEKELANYGMMLWGNVNHTYIDAAEAKSVDLNWSYYDARGWDQPNLVAYMESHDEERVMWDISKRSGYTLKDNLDRIKLNTAFFMLTPGPKMIWQFGEFGYDEELNNDRLGIKPTHWEYLEDPERLKLFAAFQSLINLKTKTDYLEASNFSWGVSSSFKWLNYDNEDVKICVFGNFGKDTSTGDPHILKTGTWYDYFTGEPREITNTSEVTLASGQFQILTSQPIDNYVHTIPYELVLKADKTSQGLNVFPNPTHGEISVITGEEIQGLALHDLSGKILMTTSTSQLNISALQDGLYVLKVQTESGIYSQKVIKENQ
ncbi:MAG: alpha-amylase family glycosyl hydrolase [Marinoscillum sp.]